MYTRLVVLSVIILAAICGLVWLGDHSIRMWAQGMEGTRLGEFATVAEQIRKDVKRKLDEFMQREQDRPYTDYQYYYVPDDVTLGREQTLLVRSPLGGSLEHGLAYGSFQIDSGGAITTPNYDLTQAQNLANDELYNAAVGNTSNIRENLLPQLGAVWPRLHEAGSDLKLQATAGVTSQSAKGTEPAKSEGSPGKQLRSDLDKGKNYVIESFQNKGQKTRVFEQRRSVFEGNILAKAGATQQAGTLPGGQDAQTPLQQSDAEQGRLIREAQFRDRPSLTTQLDGMADSSPAERAETQNQELALSDRPSEVVVKQGADKRSQSGGYEDQPQRPQTPQQQPAQRQQMKQNYGPHQQSADGYESETVQIRVEPFVPIIVPTGGGKESVFAGQVFMIRRVQIENRYLLQGFQLNEKNLIDEIKESAGRFVRDGMGFEVAKTESLASAYTAVLDFGFGALTMNLVELDPGRIGRRISELRNWYLSIVTVMLLAVLLGLASLWRNARAQLKLAQKKDDFISAVSHELRTPLTSIRMYSEMLEKDWVKSQDKRTEYYRNMRQESERLSRLIENVLDFSRIQRGRKKYAFNVGDINTCVADVVRMMSPYAAQSGFAIRTELGRIGPAAFDADAVTQIVVNLLDNAVKYARNAAEKIITVRTRAEERFTIIEVEDHGPGVPHRQREKIFEEFYRIGSESTRETTGTGLGLALVKKFAQAHNGFVEILSARPTGAIFRVGLALNV